MSETYPNKRPPYPAELSGTAFVQGTKDKTQSYSVNFDTGECDCQHGQAWRWDNRRWVPNSFCNHKMKAVASLIYGTHDDNEELRKFYNLQLGRSYNVFVAVSAMHKEIRRGDEKAALFWSNVVAAHRGTHGVVNYMRNILFEETRDLSLARYIMKLSSHGTSVPIVAMQNGVRRFCAAPKKWELPWRHDIFIDEQRGYQALIKLYGTDVAKGKDIIPQDQRGKLQRTMIKGFAEGKRAIVQEGLKGWFKSQSPDHDKMKIQILNALIDVYNGDFPNAFKLDEKYVDEVYDVVMRRVRLNGAPGYHELNAFCDALTGEPGDPRNTLSPQKHKRIVANPKPYNPPLGVRKQVPQYAHDNHTWEGKRLMRQYGAAELQPSADQTHIDFRLCGAYMGVAWRTLAFKQHGTIDCKWGDVSWRTPNWLWSHLDSMWY